MKNSFDALNAYYDKIYVLSLPRLHQRVAFIQEQLDGLNFEFFTGIDKEDTSMAQLIASGAYSPEKYSRFYKRPATMALGMLCCALGHVAIYRSIIVNGYKKTLILEDDVLPLTSQLPVFPGVIAELPADWEVFYLGYERNETFGWKQKLKRMIYMFYPNHTQLKLDRGMYSHFYPRRLSPHIATAGFHDCTHAYSVTLEGAKKLLYEQTPVGFNPDNLLSYTISTQQVKGYICRPKLFNQLSAFVHKTPSLTST